VSADAALSWLAVLDRFEADIALAVSGGIPEAWAPPEDLGPCPVELTHRALRVLDAQRETEGILAKERHTAGAHLSALTAVQDPGQTGHPLFLDIRG
jgi:hypothetical protein